MINYDLNVFNQKREIQFIAKTWTEGPWSITDYPQNFRSKKRGKTTLRIELI